MKAPEKYWHHPKNSCYGADRIYGLLWTVFHRDPQQAVYHRQAHRHHPFSEKKVLVLNSTPPQNGWQIKIQKNGNEMFIKAKSLTNSSVSNNIFYKKTHQQDKKRFLMPMKSEKYCYLIPEWNLK